jgi:hypothetical protein
MDPAAATAIITASKGGAAESKKVAEGFLKAVYAEPARSLGALIALPLNKRLFRNAVKAIVEANRLLKEAGVSPRQVPLSIIHPAMQSASLEEDPELQKTWANLLANAADPRQLKPVLPSFAGVLKELRAPDVKFLDVYYTDLLSRCHPDVSAAADIPSDRAWLMNLYDKAGLSTVPIARISRQFYDQNEPAIRAQRRMFNLTLSILKRHMIVEEQFRADPIDVDRAVVMESESTQIDIDVRSLFSLSAFGEQFIKACRPPTTV